MTLDLKFYLSIFWRRFPYFLVVATLIGAIGVSVASVLPPVYSASALLLVEGEQIPSNLARSTVTVGAAEEIQVIRQRLMTRANLIDTANRLNIYSDRPNMNPDDVVADMRRRLRIVSPSRSAARTIRVSFESEVPQVAAQVANEFVGMIERENVEMRRGLASETLRFFQEEVNRLNQEISIQRSRILAFRLENRDRLPESLDFRRNRQVTLRDRLRQTARDEEALLERRAQLVELFETTGRVSRDLTPEERELERARDQLESALRLYSPQNPRARVIQARVDELEGALAARLENEADELEIRFQEMVGQMDQELEQIIESRVELEAEIAQLQETIDASATVGIRLSELERELSAVRTQHNNAVSRLAQAQMGERIELLSKARRITVLEQAVVPRSPNRPDRPRIAMAGVGGGIAAGLGLVALLELLNRSIRRPVEITRRMGITPIVTLPYIRSRRQRMLRQLMIGGALLITVVGVPLTFWALHSYYLPLDLLIDRVLDRFGLSTLLENFL